MIERMLDLTKSRYSVFLFGPRQVGKTFLLKNIFKADIYIDLLQHSELMRYTRDISILSREIKSLPSKESTIVIVDEIQRLPILLDEIQLIMQSMKEVRFIITGSSARKLKRAGVNLLGGRALTFHLHPFVYLEIKNHFSFEDSIQFGTIPPIYLEDDHKEKERLLKSYVETYLNEEIKMESLTRNMPAFSQFLELAAHENGNILNFQNIAREIGVKSKTIKEYFQILEDTLLGFFLRPYARSHRKRIISHPKFYLFDTGVTNALRGELSLEIVQGTQRFGNLFEHYIILEIMRLLQYREREVKLSFFRTSDGAEVDLLIEYPKELWAVEIKSSSEPSLSELRGLISFIGDHKYSKAMCICLTPRKYTIKGIEFLPWQELYDIL